MTQTLIVDTIAALDRGARAEARFLAAAEHLAAFRWFGAVARTTPAQDRIGWDAIVYTRDVGRIIFQVKSSRAAALDFIRRGREMALVAPIHVVVVPYSEADAVLFGRVLGACILAREGAMAAGLRADDPRLVEIARAA